MMLMCGGGDRIFNDDGSGVGGMHEYDGGCVEMAGEGVTVKAVVVTRHMTARTFDAYQPEGEIITTCIHKN